MEKGVKKEDETDERPKNFIDFIQKKAKEIENRIAPKKRKLTPMEELYKMYEEDKDKPKKKRKPKKDDEGYDEGLTDVASIQDLRDLQQKKAKEE